MIQTNRITILVPDNGVYLDQGSYTNLDLSDCGIPSDIRALDWMSGSGELHHHDTTVHHIKITELPEWVFSCIAKWEEAHNAKPFEEILINVLPDQ